MRYAKSCLSQNILNTIFVSLSISIYLVDFTNVLKKSHLDRIAQVDIKERVKNIKEYYMDFYAPLKNYFSLNQEHCIGNSVNTWKKDALQRTVEGLTACILSMSKSPLIRFDKSSPMAYRLAEELSSQFDQKLSASSKRDQVVVLLLDRRSDLITPFLSHWTYQSMIHELLDMKNGRVSFKSINGNNNQEKITEYSLMQDEDEFYQSNLFTVFGDLGNNIKLYVESYKEKTQKNSSLKDIQDMKKFINEYGSYKKMGLVVSRHVDIIDEISRQVTEKHLLEISEIEQSIASQEQKLQSDFHNLTKIIESIDKNLQLKLLLLFYFKYKNHYNFHLVSSQITGRLEKFISKSVQNAFLEYAEYEKRDKISHSVSLKDNLISKGKATVSSLKGNIASTSTTTVNYQSSTTLENDLSRCVYTQHKPACKAIMESLTSGKLSEQQFPFFNSAPSKTAVSSNFVVFFINGCTFEEARIASAFPNMLCGATSTCNFNSIMSEITQFSMNSSLKTKQNA